MKFNMFVNSNNSNFNLSKYFAIASLIGIFVFVVASSYFYRNIAISAIKDHHTLANVDLARSFANFIWPKYHDFVLHAEDYTAEELKRRVEIEALKHDVVTQTNGLNIVKVKIYNLNGLTVFSTDTEQIGEDRSNSPRFISARSGKPASEVEEVSVPDQSSDVVTMHTLLSSYIPIQKAEHMPVDAVFEIYTDMTVLVAKLDQTQKNITTAVIASFGLLYIFLFMIVRRADRIIISQNKQHIHELEKIRLNSNDDQLTGLGNRAGFNERLADATKRVKRSNEHLALIKLNIDRFKLINDSLGYSAGDELLRVVAKRIPLCLRETDTVYRLGGDEFAIIVEKVVDPGDVAIVAKRILESLSAPIMVDTNEIVINISIGISLTVRGQHDKNILIKEADVALDTARINGGNRFIFFTGEMNALAFDRLTLESDLRNAVQNNEFFLEYQPQINTDTNQIVGVEALIRWHHPTNGLILPNNFIGVLESTGLINQVGEWVLKTACTQHKQWNEAGCPPVKISVNISSRQFKSDSIISMIKSVLDESLIDPQYLELELTESLFVDDVEKAILTMILLKDLGISISIDDFGTGYSSLSYLRQFPVDLLKIDRSFIRDLTTSRKDIAIANAIATLAGSLGMGVIAEGVEDIEQVNILKNNGCADVQGFLYSKSRHADDIEVMLKSGKVAPDYNSASINKTGS